MSDTDREWTIEHAGERLYDSSEWRETVQTLAAGELIRAALTPAGRRLTLGDD